MMRFYQFRNWVLAQLALPIRLRVVVFWYLAALMVDTRKHSQQFAATVSGLHPSQFSKLLRNHAHLAAYTLEDLSKRQANQFAPVRDALHGLPGKSPSCLMPPCKRAPGCMSRTASGLTMGRALSSDINGRISS